MFNERELVFLFIVFATFVQFMGIVGIVIFFWTVNLWSQTRERNLLVYWGL